jgi:transposase-like protein
MEALLMNEKERARLVVLSQVSSNRMTMVKAAALMALSERQAWRVYRRFAARGAAGLVHGLRGRPSNRSSSKQEVRDKAIELYRTRYGGFGPTLASEKLAEDHRIEVDHETLRRWLLKEKLWSRARKSRKHHRRRERRSCFGEMVQMDGSHHDWFEGRGKRCVLMVMIDDATGRTYARFYESETTAAAMDIFGRYSRRRGLPLSLYVDRDSIYRCERRSINDDEALLGQPQPLTQFARAMKELAVKLILANSPQAKGRVERMNGTLQDRLVKELRLAKVGDMASANELLEQKFLSDLNRRFAIEPREQTDVHRSPPIKPKLSEVLCVKEKRMVSKDGCVSWEGQMLEVDPRDRVRCGKQLEVRQMPDGTIALIGIGDQRLRWRLGAAPEANGQAVKRVIVNNKGWIPGPDHPWKATAPPRPDGPPPRFFSRVIPASATPQRELHAKRKTLTVLSS